MRLKLFVLSIFWLCSIGEKSFNCASFPFLFACTFPYSVVLDSVLYVTDESSLFVCTFSSIDEFPFIFVVAALQIY